MCPSEHADIGRTSDLLLLYVCSSSSIGAPPQGCNCIIIPYNFVRPTRN